MIESRGLSDVGLKREKNEDAILVDDAAAVYLVADGMGGHQGGECASRITVETVKEIFHNFKEDPEKTVSDEAIDAGENAGVRLQYAIRTASMRVYDEAAGNSDLAGMGTTAVGLAVNDGKAYIANVGDSRAYLIRDKQIDQLTEDHSLVMEQIKAGLVTEENARHHRLKNIITRSVGFQRDVDADLLVRDLEAGDVYLLCSDGLSNLVTDKEMLKIINKNKDLNTACQQLVEAAKREGGDDNISVILVRVGDL